MIIDLLTKEEIKLTKLMAYKEGEILFYENDECHTLGIVKSGEITISSITFKGNEIIYNRLSKGQLFGNNLLFSNDSKYRGDVKATSKSEVYLINKDNLLKILMSNKAFLNEYLSIQSNFAKSLNTQIKLLSFTSAEERFLYYLFINNDHIKFKNVTTLAQSLYLTREVTSRLLSKLEKEKRILRTSHDILFLD